MTTNQPDTAEPFDRDTFERELAELIEHARETGVDLEGAYDIRSPHPDERDYTVEVSQVAPRTSAPRS